MKFGWQNTRSGNPVGRVVRCGVHTVPYVLFATLGTFVVKSCKNAITFTMSVRLSVLRTSIRTFMKFDAEQCLLNSIGGFQFLSKSNTTDGHLT
jgi:hypothetical protein